MINKGNIVNRIGRLRRHRAWAVCVAVVAIGIAVAGWVKKPVIIIQDRMPHASHDDCMYYAEKIMCNN